MSRTADLLVWLAGVAAATAVVLLFTLEGGTVDAPADGPGSADLALGQAVYQQHCANCHGTEGQGGTGAKLAGELLDAYPDPVEQAAVLLTGKGVMPSFAELLSAEEIDAVVAFTRAELG